MKNLSGVKDVKRDGQNQVIKILNSSMPLSKLIGLRSILRCYLILMEESKDLKLQKEWLLWIFSISYSLPQILLTSLSYFKTSP